MKKTLKYLAIPIAAILTMATLSGCQVFRGERSVSQYTSDTQLTAKVKTALAKSDEISANRVNVETDKGVVLLSGFAKNPHQRATATKIAKSVEGVESVKNKMVIAKKSHHNNTASANKH